MITVKGVSHVYGRGGGAVEALDNISVTFSSGTTALLGPNGSGKSTLMNIIGTSISPTQGDVFYNDTRVDRATVEDYRAQLGVVPQHISLPKRMRLSEVLSYLCWVHKVPAARNRQLIDSVLERLDLAEKRNSRVGELSGGQLRRAGFACALLHEPSVLLLDEPTVGLDPEVRVEIRRLIADIATSATVLLSTHLLEDVRFLDPEVAMIKAGQIVFSGSYAQFTATLPNGKASRDSSIEQAYQQMLHAHPSVSTVVKQKCDPRR
ncbi:putative ABC transporter ATP-binding protein YxlF [Corynebacterium cystitidis DSM 20524]|uniref:ABC transporter n=1 Tax=Corynebacterium cystitidis DSM 20524 TaxID=1121357 RepID=A0A1H9WNF5_9CORY|nr:putative ABC transporter ATP-binding protein YxlF [Corynebacterium cystitidis DSM 20524]SES35405.1 ABC transporter [Corynebacterium cystitidis DSM 20524]SNV88028.1 ABC transporter ATP-binding protein [Corynebacterium cystitidis]